MDLSPPEGFSVNDGISKDDCSFHYTSVDAAVAHISQARRGCCMAKMDIKSAYQNILVAPSDQLLLGFQWQENVFVNKVLEYTQHQSSFQQ